MIDGQLSGVCEKDPVLNLSTDITEKLLKGMYICHSETNKQCCLLTCYLSWQERDYLEIGNGAYLLKYQ